LWLKTRSAEASTLHVKSRTAEGEGFRSAIDRLRQDATLGGRLSEAEYVSDIASRDREWLGIGEEVEAVEGTLEKVYRQQEAAWQA